MSQHLSVYAYERKDKHQKLFFSNPVAHMSSFDIFEYCVTRNSMENIQNPYPTLEHKLIKIIINNLEF